MTTKEEAIVEALKLTHQNLKTVNEILLGIADRLDDIDVWRLAVDRKLAELTARRVS